MIIITNLKLLDSLNSEYETLVNQCHVDINSLKIKNKSDDLDHAFKSISSIQSKVSYAESLQRLIQRINKQVSKKDNKKSSNITDQN